jgi:hypothetical protein
MKPYLMDFIFRVKFSVFVPVQAKVCKLSRLGYLWIFFLNSVLKFNLA